jgi:hypothetical protein
VTGPLLRGWEDQSLVMPAHVIRPVQRSGPEEAVDQRGCGTRSHDRAICVSSLAVIPAKLGHYGCEARWVSWTHGTSGLNFESPRIY